MKQVPEISEECSKAFQKLNSLNIKNCEDFDALAKAVGYTDDNFVKFLKDTNYSEKTLENYQQYMQKANSATSKFSATLKSVAANMGIMFAATLVIKGIAWVIDEVVHRQDKLNDAASASIDEYNALKGELDSINAELKTTQDRISELENKPKLSFVEQEELEKLRSIFLKNFMV